MATFPAPPGPIRIIPYFDVVITSAHKKLYNKKAPLLCSSSGAL